MDDLDELPTTAAWSHHGARTGLEAVTITRTSEGWTLDGATTATEDTTAWMCPTASPSTTGPSPVAPSSTPEQERAIASHGSSTTELATGGSTASQTRTRWITPSTEIRWTRPFSRIAASARPVGLARRIRLAPSPDRPVRGSVRRCATPSLRRSPPSERSSSCPLVRARRDPPEVEPDICRVPRLGGAERTVASC